MSNTNVITSAPRPTFWKTAGMLVGTFFVVNICLKGAEELHSPWAFVIIKLAFICMLAAWASDRLPPALRIGTYGRVWAAVGFLFNSLMLMSDIKELALAAAL